MKKFNCEDSVDDLIDAILEGKTDEEKVKILRHALSDAMTHGWVDDDLRDSMMANLAREYDIPYHSVEDDEVDDEDSAND